MKMRKKQRQRRCPGGNSCKKEQSQFVLKADTGALVTDLLFLPPTEAFCPAKTMFSEENIVFAR